MYNHIVMYIYPAISILHMWLHLYMRPMGGCLSSPPRVYLHDVKKGQIKIIERKKNH